MMARQHGAIHERTSGGEIRTPMGEFGFFCSPSGGYRLTEEGKRYLADWLAINSPIGLLASKYPELNGAARGIIGADETEALCFQGVVRATITFDPSRGLKFTTYALPWMRNMVATELTHSMVHKKNTCFGGEDMIKAVEVSTEVEIDQTDEVAYHLNRLLAWMGKFLSRREAHVVMRRAEGETLAGLGVELNITKERVRQIHLRSLERAKRAMAMGTATC